MDNDRRQADIDIAVIKQQLINQAQGIDRIEKHCSTLFKVLEGNGTDGVLQRQAVHRQWLRLMWGIVALQTTCILGIAYQFIQKGIGG